jgi:hypothetical protein
MCCGRHARSLGSPADLVKLQQVAAAAAGKGSQMEQQQQQH